MNTFVESAFACKALRLVQQQAQLGDSDNQFLSLSLIHQNNDDDSSSATAAATIDHPSRRRQPRQHQQREAPLRHMSYFDLVAFGVGSTIGGGVFVLSSVAAHSYAGPAACLSYLLAGCVVGLTALPYAELSAAFPVDGSTYLYAYIALGEIYAVIASMCQTLVYGGAGAAVSRSWGNKFVRLAKLYAGGRFSDGLMRFLEPGYYINPMAAIIALSCTLVLLLGVRESKLATNITSSAKVSLIIFMIVAGMVLSSNIFPGTKATFSNWEPFIPAEFGVEGIFKASSLLVFAFTSFDAICNQAGEAKDPVKDVPRAVLSTVVIDVTIYVLMTLALTAMLPYTEIDPVSGFSSAFGANGWAWAEFVTAIGEVLVLPLVVLTSIQAQTRLMFAMSNDGIVPKFFGKLTFSNTKYCGKEDEIGNLVSNVRFCGLATVCMATFVPSEYIIELTAAGGLLLFSMTSCCLLAIRYKCPSDTCLLSARDPLHANGSVFSVVSTRSVISLGQTLTLLNLFPFISGLCFSFIPINALRCSLTVFFAFLTLVMTIYIAVYFHENTSTPYIMNSDGYGTPGQRRFRTPWVPFLPSFGIYLNWFMLANLGWKGIVMLISYLFVGITLYWRFCVGKSLVNKIRLCNEDESYKNHNLISNDRCNSTLPTTSGLNS